MIVRFITNKRQKEHLARLIGIGRFVNSKDIETLQNEYKSTAIITKDYKEAEDLYDKLKDHINISLVDANTKKFQKNLINLIQAQLKILHTHLQL